MKLSFKSLSLLSLFIFVAASSQAQLNFSVQPGLTLNSAHFGYVINERFVPYIGIQHYNFNTTLETTGERFNFDSGVIENFSRTAETSVSVIIPTVGLKYFFYQSKPLKAYGNANLSKPIPFGNSSAENRMGDPVKEALEEVSLWGGEIGFGTEYFFAPSFSIGGEFGLRWISFNQNTTYTNDVIFDPNTGSQQELEATDDLSINLNPTYARLSLNFYFQ